LEVNVDRAACEASVLTLYLHISSFLFQDRGKSSSFWQVTRPSKCSATSIQHSGFQVQELSGP